MHFLIISLIILYLLPGNVCFIWLQVTYIYVTANHFANHAAVLQIRMCFSFHLRRLLLPIHFCCSENQCADSWNMLYLCYPSQWTASLHPFLSKLHYCFALMTFQMNLHSNCIIMQRHVTYKNECRLDVHCNDHTPQTCLLIFIPYRNECKPKSAWKKNWLCTHID